MTIDLTARYTGRADGSGPNPSGAFQNESDEGNNDGTPLEVDFINDIIGPREAMIAEAGLLPSGVVDNANLSQALSAMERRWAKNTMSPIMTISKLCEQSFYGIYDWSNPGAHPNVVTSAGDIFRDACIGWDATTQKPCLYIVDDSDAVRKVTGPWEYGSAPSIGADIGLSYPSTPTSVRSVCCDGDYLYVLWRNSSSNTYQVTCFDINNSYAREWTRATGVDYAYASPENVEYAKVICADSTHLAVSTDSAGGGGGVGTGVIVMPKSDTGSSLIGLGNSASCSAGDSVPAGGRIVSDGDHIFWLARTDSNPAAVVVHLCSASISNPSTSSYTACAVGTAKDTTGSGGCSSVPCGILNIGGSTGVIAMSTPDGQIYQFSKTDDEVRFCIQLDNHSQYYSGSPVVYNTVLGHDGLNLWAHLVQTNIDAGTVRVAFAKVPNSLMFASNGGPLAHQDYTASQVLTNLSTTPVADYEPGRILADNKDLWFVARDGFIARITNPGMR